MKTIHKLFLIATIALGLGFVACSDSDVVSQGVDDAKTNTHVSVSLKLSTNASTRALPDDYNKIGEWAGKDKIKTIAIYLVDGDAVTAKTFQVGTDKDYTFSQFTGELVPARESAAIKTTAGAKTVYVLINGTPEVVNHLAMAQPTAFKESFEETALALANSGTDAPVETSASKIAGKNGTTDETIVMTSVKPGEISVDEKVTAAETIAGARNRVSVNVERAVARVMVTIADKTSFEVKDVDSNLVGTVTNVTWVLAQGENKLYVQRKSAWETPSFEWVPADNAAYIADAGDRYDYSGLFENQGIGFGGTEVATMAAYSGTEGEITTELENKLSGKFVLPTTHEVATGEASSYKKGNTPYVLIRAQFTPKVFADDETYTYTAGDDFFVGANGKFYTSAANAVDITKGGVTGQTVARYVGGKVLYYAWLNPDKVAEPYNSPVLRNNIYHIHITGFKNLGTNWNPLFPEVPPTLTNPNDPWHPVDNPIIPGGGKNPDPKPTPDPTDPDYPQEPENPIDPEDPLTTPVTYMSVDVTVLPWNVHSYSVDLGM